MYIKKNDQLAQNVTVAALQQRSELKDTSWEALAVEVQLLLTPRNPIACCNHNSSYMSITDYLNGNLSMLARLNQLAPPAKESLERTSFVNMLPFCQLVNRCRLTRSLSSFTVSKAGMGPLPALLDQLIMALARHEKLITEIRQPRGLISSTEYDSHGNLIDLIDPQMLLRLDRDALTEALTRFSSLGWTSLSMFQQTLTSYLGLLNQSYPDASEQDSLSAPHQMDGEERVEKNHLLASTISAIGKLLLDSCAKPLCGNPILSSQPHKYRFPTSTFKLSK
ncbi:hypothetical protein Ciccas_006660 [Cichlidogyrus casuarinus]|uniref:Uncharacterized protein n=1 Tax=Cichlidogyrus casuarinus TaxID=1844966 RepID=A0ABD2Q554_9PLAT